MKTYILAACAALALSACSNEIHSSYKPANIASLLSEGKQNDRFVVSGLPSLVRENSFVLNEGEHQLSVERLGDQSLNQSYPETVEALKAEATDGDEQTVRVIGIYNGDSTLKGFMVEIDGTVHPYFY